MGFQPKPGLFLSLRGWYLYLNSGSKLQYLRWVCGEQEKEVHLEGPHGRSGFVWSNRKPHGWAHREFLHRSAGLTCTLEVTPAPGDPKGCVLPGEPPTSPVHSMVKFFIKDQATYFLVSFIHKFRDPRGL